MPKRKGRQYFLVVISDRDWKTREHLYDLKKTTTIVPSRNAALVF